MWQENLDLRQKIKHPYSKSNEEEDNKTLGIRYLVKEDKLYGMASIDFPRRKKKNG